MQHLQSAQEQVQTLTEQSAASQAVLRGISRALPPTLGQQSRWQAEEERETDAEGTIPDSRLSCLRPEEVLEQLQSFVHAVQADQDRYKQLLAISVHQKSKIESL